MYGVKCDRLDHADSVTCGAHSVNKKKRNVTCAVFQLHSQPIQGQEARSPTHVQRTEVTGEGEKSAEVVVSVNMHWLGESFVEKVSDVRRRSTVDGQAAAPGESLEFLAHIRGCQSEARKQRRDKLLQLDSDTWLRVALTAAAGADIFFIPEIHFARETPELDDEGWWYQVRAVSSVI